ncbi:hypothetical protein B0H34DRAFT_713699 [Crassisporium funariophilum]|nr:hypothetical protein B0H34DRAFT_713699 [Crassisporium funariophilum]
MNESTNATASSSTAPATPTPANTENYAQVVRALGNVLKAQTGETASIEKISQLLLQNMAHLVHSGAVTKQQIIQVLKEFADQLRPPGSQPAPAMLTNQTPQKPAPPPPVSGTHHGALKAADSASQLPNLAATSVEFYPTINSTLNTVNPGPVPWPQTRPTLTGGVVGGRISGTPAQVARPSDDLGKGENFEEREGQESP